MGLGVRERKSADRLVDEMNQILSDPTLWDASARGRAQNRFSARTVEIFYHDLTPEPMDFFAIRDAVIPLPSSKYAACRTVLLVGTTGVGKTTLVRQLLGTSPTEERFPSTSTAKTTIADTELILDSDRYRAVVTFLPRDLVRDYVEECLIEAVLAACRNEPDADVLRYVLSHSDQRFRLSYVLGKGESNPGEDDDEVERPTVQGQFNALHTIDLKKTNAFLKDMLGRVQKVSAIVRDSLKQELNASESDARVLEEIIEENAYDRLREDNEFQELVDEMMEEIELRFDPLSNFGELKKTKQGWPQCWHWESGDRRAFLNNVLRFSSNYPAYFGTLLTPLVNGIRVAGPFGPAWRADHPHLTLLDTEGLGHTPDSSASLPTSLIRRLHEVDAIVLVDTAKHPLQAASLAALREIVTSGLGSKLLICFTHMDMMDEDSLPSFRAKTGHVKDSVRNALMAIGGQNGPAAERALRERFANGTFYVGEINRQLDPHTKDGQRTIEQLCKMLDAIEAIVEKPEQVQSFPVYERTELILGIAKAVEDFHDEWRARLGMAVRPSISKAHWTQIRALTRRLAEGWQDHYLDLRPISDLSKDLQEKIYMFIQGPTGWKGPEPADEIKQNIFDSLATAVAASVLDIVTRRISVERTSDWQRAFDQRGSGSSYARAAVIQNEIYSKAAPIPNIAPLPENQRNEFLREVLSAVEAVAKQLNVQLK
ncbi:MAG: hypothetical protein ACRD11_14015 [Terriglobia bacterium]